jgi:hypothetical protein
MPRLIYIIIISAVFFCGWFLYLQFSAPSETIAHLTPVAKLAEVNYEIYFVKPVQEANKFVLYAVKGDGTQEKFVQDVGQQALNDALVATSVYLQGNKYTGDFLSPDGQKKIVVKTGVLGISWLARFSQPKIYIEQNNKQTFYLKTSFDQLRWLPDSKTVALVKDNTISLFNIETNQITNLTSGAGVVDIK